MMETIIKQLSYEETAEIYNEWLGKHFPADEIKPLKNIARMWNAGNYSALALYDRECFENTDALKGLVGYAFFVNSPLADMVLLDYYAIIGAYRNQGMGSLFLRKMKDSLHGVRGIIIETEDVGRANSEEELRIRKRRDRFYVSNGAVETGIRTSVYGVPYAIWSLASKDEVISETESLHAVEGIYKTMFPPKLWGTHIIIQGKYYNGGTYEKKYK